jgi:hypothetical protein
VMSVSRELRRAETLEAHGKADLRVLWVGRPMGRFPPSLRVALFMTWSSKPALGWPALPYRLRAPTRQGARPWLVVAPRAQAFLASQRAPAARERLP